MSIYEQKPTITPPKVDATQVAEGISIPMADGSTLVLAPSDWLAVELDPASSLPLIPAVVVSFTDVEFQANYQGPL